MLPEKLSNGVCSLKPGVDSTYPEIAVMQTKAVIKAAINVKKNHPDWAIVPEIMIPLTGETKELKFVKDIVVKTANEVIAAAGVELKYEVGTMIEIPRACLTAEEIAKEAEFFCFGTNDLTQMTFGFSRDDAGKFLPAYYALAASSMQMARRFVMLKNQERRFNDE